MDRTLRPALVAEAIGTFITRAARRSAGWPSA